MKEPPEETYYQHDYPIPCVTEPSKPAGTAPPPDVLEDAAMTWKPAADRPGYMEYFPSRTERFIKFVANTKIRWRYCIIGLMFFVSLLQFGAQSFKAAAVALAVYGLMIMPLGTRYIERAGLVVFAIAAVMWLDIIPQGHIAALWPHTP